MRRQAKPFTVEIRKSRKSAGSPEPLLGILDVKPEPSDLPAATAAAIATQKLFGRPVEAEAPKPEAARREEARRPVILDAIEARPRVLPDLTVEEKAAAEPAAATPARRVLATEEGNASALKKPRAPRKPRIVEAKTVQNLTSVSEEAAILLPVEPERGAAEANAAKRAKRRPRIALRRRGDALLPVFRAGERWKRRLPPSLW